MKISIIIPTLNEVQYLRNTVQNAIIHADFPDRLELLIVDAGSTDATLATINNLDVKTFTNIAFKLQKHKSLNFGLEQAKGEVVLFLDADTLLPKHFDTLITEKLKEETVVGGAFEMRFSNPDVKLLVLSIFNSLRYNIWKTYYGDQAIFCRREAALKVGGFQDTLMEAAHFCKAIRKLGQLRTVKQPVITSPRRFREGGFWSVFWYDVKMWFRFIFGRDLKKFQKTYWKTNLHNG